MSRPPAKRIRKLARHQTRGGLTEEQKEHIIDCLACRMPTWQIIEDFEARFDRKAPSRQTIRDYRERYAEEILRRRETWRQNVTEAGIPFVLQFERIRQYSHFAMIELRRRRYEEARKHMHEIALELGDLKERRELTGRDGGPIDFRIADMPDAELDREIAGRLAAAAGQGNENDDPGAAQKTGTFQDDAD